MNTTFIDWPTTSLIVGLLISVLTFVYKLINLPGKEDKTIKLMEMRKESCPINPAVSESITTIKTELHDFKLNSKEHWEKIDKKFDQLENKLDEMNRILLLHVGKDQK